VVCVDRVYHIGKSRALDKVILLSQYLGPEGVVEN
jgi:hypothetical protein